MCSALFRWSLGGFAANWAILVTVNAMLGLVPSIRYNRDPITVWYLLHNSRDATSSDLIGTYPAGRGVTAFLELCIPHRSRMVFR